MVATYGAGVLSLDRDSEAWLQLWLNLSRQHARRAMQIKEGFELASGKSQAPIDYYEAVSDNAEQAELSAYREAVAAKESSLVG